MIVVMLLFIQRKDLYMQDFSCFARCLEFALAGSLGSMEHDGVKVEALSLDDIKILVYLDEKAKNASSIRGWVEGFLRRNKFEIGDIVPDMVSVSYSVSCSEQVVESFLRSWKPWMSLF